MSLDLLLEKLEGVRPRGNGKYTALCPAHEDKHPSLAIAEKENGAIVMHCFAGCGAGEILEMLGLDFAALYPQNTRPEQHNCKPFKRPFDPRHIFAAVAGEALTVVQFSRQLASGTPLSGDDHDRLVLAIQRILTGLELMNA